MQQAPVRNIEAAVIDVSDIERAIAFWSSVVGRSSARRSSPRPGGRIDCADPNGNEFCLTTP